MISAQVFGTRWDLQWFDAYAAAMHCKSATEEEWDRARMDCHPSEAVEFADIVTQEVLRGLDPEVIREMCEGYVVML